MKLNFNKTCDGCPEQYDVYDENGRYVAYIRLRWGHLRVDDDMGNTIYSHDFEECYKGWFDTDEEREAYLGLIGTKIQDHYSNRDYQSHL